MDGITEIKQTKSEKYVKGFTSNADRIALIILILWCALPVFMTVYHLITGVVGAFPTELPEGMALGNIVYNKALDTYYTAFCVVGGITLFYGVLCILLCVPRIFDKNSFKHNIWFYLLAALLFWAVISTFVSDDFEFAFIGGNYMHNGLLSYFFYAGVFLCASMIKKEKHRRILFYVFCGVLSWLCAISLLRETGIYFLEYCFPTRHSAVFNNSNHFGYVLCIGVAAAAGMFLFGVPHEPEMARKSGTEGVTDDRSSLESEFAAASFASSTASGPPSPTGEGYGEAEISFASSTCREPPTLSSSRRGTPAAVPPSPTGEGTPSVASGDSSPEGGASLIEGGGSALAETEGVNGSGDRSPTTVCASFTVGEGSPLPNSEFRIQSSESNRSAEQISALSYSKRALINKIVSLCFLTLFTVTLLINNTFGAFIGASFGIAAAYVFYFVRRGKVRWYVFLPVVIFIALTVLNSVKIIPSATPIISDVTKTAEDVQKIVANDPDAGRAGSSRWTLWKTTFERILQRPIFGFGPEGFVGEYKLTSAGTTTHNEYLQMAGYLGIPALLLYLAALVTLAVKQWKRLKRLDPLVVVFAGGTVAYLVSAFVGNPVFNTAPFFWMFLGLTSCGDEPPLLSLEDAAVSERLFAKTEKKSAVKKILPIAAVGVILIVGVTVFYNYKIENSNEKADLQSMYMAENVAKLNYLKKQPEGTESFWFDCFGLALVPTDEKMPAPYGLGESRKGKGTAAFVAETGKEYEYDEGIDYRNKIIRVDVKTDDNGELSVSVAWVEHKE